MAANPQFARPRAAGAIEHGSFGGEAGISADAAFVRNELRLARTETARQLAYLGGTVALASIGAAFLIAAIVVFLESAVAALITSQFSLADASLIVGGPALVFGLLILWAATRRMRIRNVSLENRP